MAKKSGSRLAHRETRPLYIKQNSLPDEIALRDEILELKRQLMILKRTNEQYLVKLRKYDDEAKRKDKQLEQLMDPRKNSDITKVLSTKGAAILMNLKDQNNALIQMILNKDLHIRRLVAEIKMSKLYASTKKNEGYRAEISRLRNLLIKSQETLKENVDFHEQSRSICVSGNSFFEFSSSSDQSSPRDLDELRLTILSLESHIQQSNDLLAKKNQEILLLRDEVNFLKKLSHNKTFKHKPGNYKPTQSKDYESQISFEQGDAIAPTKILNQDIINFFHKSNNQQNEKLVNHAESVSEQWTTSTNPFQKYNFHSFVSEKTTRLIETNEENVERVNKACSVMGKSLFHHLAADEIKREEKILSNLESTVHVKEKWKKALNKYKELKQVNPQMFSGCVHVKEVYLNYENKSNEFLEDKKKLQNSIKINQNNQKLEEEFANSDLLENSNSTREKTEDTDDSSTSSHTNDHEDSNTCQSSEKKSWITKDDETDTALSQEIPTEQETKKTEVQSPRDGLTSKNPMNSDATSEVNPKEPFQENYFHSLDSSFDSDYGYSMKQEVQQVQVEVQINSVSSQSDNDLSGNNISETNQFNEYKKENNGNHAPELDFNDDDDVIICEK